MKERTKLQKVKMTRKFDVTQILTNSFIFCNDIDIKYYNSL